MRHAISNRVGYLAVAGVLVAVLSVGLGDRLLTRWAYAFEQGRIQANSDELAGVQEVSRAFRMVAKIVRPGVVHIRTSDWQETVRRQLEERLQELHRGLQESGRRFEALQERLRDDPHDAKATRELVRLLRERSQLESEQEELLGRLRQGANSGSGFVLDREGRILTNNHVVGGRAGIVARLRDEREYDATLVGTDPKTDLAVIKVNAPDLHPLEFGDSDKMEVGDWVLAVGAPFGLTQSVTHGIISAKGRRNIAAMAPIYYQDFLQTDAAINPGNSGGPLVNLRGEVIGVNTAISTDGERYNMGVAFTVPSNMAARIAKQLIAHGEVARGWLGVSLSELTDEDVELFGVKDKHGAMVNVLYENSPGRDAELRCEDVITAVNDKPVRNIRELQAAIADVDPGEHAALRVLRDGQAQLVSVHLGKQPEDIDSFVQNAQAIKWRQLEALALHVRTMRDDLPITLARLPGGDLEFAGRVIQHTDKRGVLVLDVVRPGEAEKATGESPGGLAPGELIVSCNDRPVASVTELTQAIEAAGDSRHVELVVLEPDGERRTVRVKRR